MKHLSNIIALLTVIFCPALAQAQIKAYAWDWHSVLTPMVWLRCDADLRKQINGVATRLKAQPQGSRVLFLWHDWPNTWTLDKGWGNMVANGPFNVKENRAFLENAFRSLAAVDAVPDRIVMDDEFAPTPWWIKAEPEKVLRDLFENPQAMAKMPALSKYSAADFLWGTPHYRDAYITFGKWGAEQHLLVIRQTSTLAKDSFGHAIPVLSYNEEPEGLQDPNGWPTYDTSVSGFYTPVPYITTGGQLISNNDRLKKKPRWNYFIYNLNHVRACVATGKPVAPWVSHPRYGGDNQPDIDPWLWVELQKHLAASGVAEVLYWNPRAGQRDFDGQSKLAAATWAALKPAPKPPALPTIASDADEIVTGDVITRYADFKE